MPERLRDERLDDGIWYPTREIDTLRSDTVSELLGEEKPRFWVSRSDCKTALRAYERLWCEENM